MKKPVRFATASLLVSLMILYTSCGSRPQPVTLQENSADLLRPANLEAREDSLEMVRAREGQSAFPTRLQADLETEPVQSGQDEDAADDPAIWYNTADPAASLVLGTDKNAGIYVYDLDGRVKQFRNVGRINNIDLRDGFLYQNREMVLVAGSNRSNNCITLFLIDPVTGILTDSILNLPSSVDEVYGLCLFHPLSTNQFYVFVNGKGGKLEQWQIMAEGDKISGHVLRSFMLSSQPEGMVADDRYEKVYLGVEMEGIFRLHADPAGDTVLVKISGSDQSNPKIAYDIEGLAIFTIEDRDYLMASSQGNFSFAIFSIGENEEYLTSFIITDGSVDGVEETDGLEVITRPLNARFPQGMLVVQDGFNTDDGEPVSQNFKYVSFHRIEALLKP